MIKNLIQQVYELTAELKIQDKAYNYCEKDACSSNYSKPVLLKALKHLFLSIVGSL